MLRFEKWSWLYVACFLDFLGASMIMPVFGSHLRSLGISHSLVGLLSSCYGAIQLVSSPIVGSWSDINGRRTTLGLTIVLSSVAYGLMGIVSSFYLFCVIRCLLGSFKHTQTLCRAYVADIVPEDKQASVQGLMNAVTSFSFMIGPVFSGHMMEVENGFQLLTRVVVVIFILNASVVYIFAGSEETTRKVKESTKHKQDTFFSKLSLTLTELYSIEWRSFWVLFSVKFLFGLAGMVFFQNLGVVLTENYEITPKYMGYTISFYGFLSGLCSLSVGKIKSIGILPTNYLQSLMYTTSLLAITLLLLYCTKSYAMFIVGLVPLATSHALTRIFLTEVLLDQSDASCRGSMMGAASSIASVARTIAPFLSGLVISWKGTSSALLLSSSIAITACLLSRFHLSQVHSKAA